MPRTKESGIADDRAQIRATILDADLSEVWLRSKVRQLLDSCDELVAERDALREAAQALVTARAEGARIEPWGALITALKNLE